MGNDEIKKELQLESSLVEVIQKRIQRHLSFTYKNIPQSLLMKESYVAAGMILKGVAFKVVLEELHQKFSTT
jgi:hypothetical protein